MFDHVGSCVCLENSLGIQLVPDQNQAAPSHSTPVTQTLPRSWLHILSPCPPGAQGQWMWTEPCKPVLQTSLGPLQTSHANHANQFWPISQMKKQLGKLPSPERVATPETQSAPLKRTHLCSAEAEINSTGR